MHVCMLCTGRFPDERVEKEASALDEAGHAVTVCARGANGDPDREIVEGIDVRRLPDDSLYAGVKGKLDGARYALRFVHPAWVRAAGETNDERPVDVYCVQDLSLVKTGLKIGATLHVPVVCDLPGNPTTYAGTDSRGGRLRRVARRVFHSPWRLNRLETKQLPDADRLVASTEEARARYVREKGIDSRRAAVVRDTANLGISTNEPTDDHGLEFDPEDSFVVTVFGDSSTEELKLVIEAAARAADEAISLQLLLVDDLDEDTISDLETLARQRLAGGRVTFRTETDRAADHVAASDVCVFSRASTPTTETSVPTELFYAMAMGVPGVVSDVAPFRRIVSRTNAGYVVPIGDREALSDVLVALSDPETATELGANGRLAAEREFNWERDTERLRMLYESLSESSEEIIRIDEYPQR